MLEIVEFRFGEEEGQVQAAMGVLKEEMIIGIKGGGGGSGDGAIEGEGFEGRRRSSATVVMKPDTTVEMKPIDWQVSIHERRDALIRESKYVLKRVVTTVIDFRRYFPGKAVDHVWQDFSVNNYMNFLKKKGRAISQWIYLGGVKAFADGSLDSNSAVFYEFQQVSVVLNRLVLHSPVPRTMKMSNKHECYKDLLHRAFPLTAVLQTTLVAEIKLTAHYS